MQKKICTKYMQGARGRRTRRKGRIETDRAGSREEAPGLDPDVLKEFGFGILSPEPQNPKPEALNPKPLTLN